ncbi:cAMP-responsive element modulator isoform X3 [Molothrus ater]|uniref:cAMP-responsive element modulator isoform X3 n=2 Tax=Molothrus TaxID=84832 RepID=UPI00174E252F|nr:cAMP-responsive element modulator isoform X3 [Molothrus ater]XP_054485314.1 cAMP-responsive element modulator isoform X3 [Agelaius phoeniceus]
MTMEMVEQDDNAVDSLTERSAGHLQNQPGQNQISSGSEVSVAASSAGRGSPAVTLVQLPSGQTVHVQGVIQATQPSVIQSPHMQAVQVASIADEAAQSEVIIDSQKRREILSRRPSYRKILNELSSDAPAIAKIEEEEKSEDEGTPSVTISQGGTIQTVTNSGAPQPGATIVQYAAQSSDGTQQFFLPGSQVVVQAATGDMPAYQIRTPTTTLPQGVVMAASPGTLHSPQQMAEEATRKRELRLLKNREAARECRRKKKEYVKCLENRVAVLENQNKTLIEELKALKDLYCHKAE